MAHKKIMIALDGSERMYYAARTVRYLFQEWQPEIALVFVFVALQMTGSPEADIMPQEAAIILEEGS